MIISTVNSVKYIHAVQLNVNVTFADILWSFLPAYTCALVRAKRHKKDTNWSTLTIKQF